MSDSLIIDENLSSAQITDRSKGFLKEVGKWSKFFAIIGAIGTGLMVIGALFMLIFASTMSGMRGPLAQSGMAQTPVLLGVVYLIMAAIYVIPIIYMFKFSANIAQAVKSDASSEYEISFDYLKRIYKYFGIFTIVILSIYIFLFLIGIIAVAAA